MGVDEWKQTVAIEISDIHTDGDNYTVIIAATGKAAILPSKWTEIRPGHAIIPVALQKRILGMESMRG
jgi:hypothetical protein